jgi:hypothetical protein
MVGAGGLGRIGQNEYQSQDSGLDAGQQEQTPFGVTTNRTVPPSGRTVPVVTSAGTVIGSGTFNPSTGYIETDIRTTTVIEQTAPPQTGVAALGIPQTTQVTAGQTSQRAQPSLTVPDVRITFPKRGKGGRYSVKVVGVGQFGAINIRAADMLRILLPKGYQLLIRAFDASGNPIGNDTDVISGESYAYPVGAAYLNLDPLPPDDPKIMKATIMISWAVP